MAMPAAPQRAFLALVLVLLTLVSGGWSRAANPKAPADGNAPFNRLASKGALQEVSPPAAVQQLNERFTQWTPKVEVLAPADNAVLAAGTWELSLRIKDWPIADAGALGLGPHLVVQVDDEQPLRLHSEQAAERIAMPELRAGSHRITVYAAKPWGEAVKSPGASHQIRVHRVARNAAELPASGSPQLIATAPNSLQQMEPVLIDWLMLDAPLQNLRDDDTRWRLRITVNGDSFLVDRQTPIWLKGFQRGSNAVQLELLDGRGDPLNPPFNSLIREVVISNDPPAPWQGGNLNADVLGRLSGEATAAEPEPAPATNLAPAAETAQQEAVQEAEPDADAPAAAPPPMEEEQPEQDAGSTEAEQPEPEIAMESEERQEEPQAGDQEARAAETDAEATLAEEQNAPETMPSLSEAPSGSPAATDAADAPPSDRPSASARDLVNADGSMRQTEQPGLLGRLKEKLGG
jgi:hypothetical protein